MTTTYYYKNGIIYSSPNLTDQHIQYKTKSPIEDGSLDLISTIRILEQIRNNLTPVEDNKLRHEGEFINP